MTKTVWSYYDTNTAAALGWALTETWYGWILQKHPCNSEAATSVHAEVKALASKGHPLARKALEIATAPYRIQLNNLPVDLTWEDYEMLLGKKCQLGTILGVTRGKRQAENNIYLVINTPSGNTVDYQVSH